MIVDHLRVIGSPQTNKVMAGELSRLAVRTLGRRPQEPRKAGTGQLIYPFDPALALVAATWQRTSTRALWDLYSSRATRLEPLYDELVADVRADERGWLGDNDSVSVEVRRVGDFAAGERQIVGTVKNAIVDGLAARGVRIHVDPERPDVLVHARLDDDGAMVISADLGGASLSQRGWRIEHGPAPMREHLAAVLLMLARFDPRRDVLVDPMCGAGTICLEAALMARGEPSQLAAVPGDKAAWPAAAHRPVFAAALADLRSAGWWPPAPLFADAAPVIIGNELEVNALVNAKRNAASAGCIGQVVWRRGDFRTLDARELTDIARERQAAAATAAGSNGDADDASEEGATGLILCNPPYGERLDDIDLRELYADLAEWTASLRGFRAAFIVANPDFEVVFRRSPRIKKPLSNGNLRGYFYLYDPV